jgi:NADPH:quinone reductase-like Zn-dependent oxidoreductase
MSPACVSSIDEVFYDAGWTTKWSAVMKAICVTASRDLEVRDIPMPEQPAAGHVLVAMAASAINHGDKTFLKMPAAAGPRIPASRHDVWGASGAGKVVALGAGVPADYAGKQVAIYRSLTRSPDSVGLWCETAAIPYTSCLILPDHVNARDYCGSLVNVITAYAFLEEIAEAGHKGVIVTAGSSATGHAMAALARARHMPAIFLVRSEAAAEKLRSRGVEHVIVTRDGYAAQLATLAAELQASAVFDGVGGELLGNIAPALPMNATVYCYGFLGAAAPAAMHTTLFMMKNLTIRRFSNFESATVKQPARLVAALKALEPLIADPMFATWLGQEFSYGQIGEAMAYASPDGRKAILTV